MSAAARTLSLIGLCGSVRRRSAHKMLLRYAVARHRRRPDLSPLQLRKVVHMTHRCRRLFKCKACHRQFSADQRNFGARVPKAAGSDAAHGFQLVRQRAAKGISSLQLSRYLGLHAKTAFVLLHKLRCALTANFGDDPFERGR